MIPDRLSQLLQLARSHPDHARDFLVRAGFLRPAATSGPSASAPAVEELQWAPAARTFAAEPFDEAERSTTQRSRHIRLRRRGGSRRTDREVVAGVQAVVGALASLVSLLLNLLLHPFARR